jgi:hypothetical protein
MNGPSAGSGYGDDAESDENYPIVRLTNTAGTVFYARTGNWSNTRVGRAVANETVDCTLKPGMVPGDYSMEVIGAGVALKVHCVTISAAETSGTGGGSDKPINCRGKPSMSRPWGATAVDDALPRARARAVADCAPSNQQSV